MRWIYSFDKTECVNLSLVTVIEKIDEPAIIAPKEKAKKHSYLAVINWNDRNETILFKSESKQARDDFCDDLVLGRIC